MKALIEEFNGKLKALLEELRGKKSELEASLAEVQAKIDVKIEEAKKYKVEVDNAKGQITRLEAEIDSLEDDLADLTNRFSNKNLEVILETGNREINSQIEARQQDIERQREHINEYTEKARTIKDLLISLKKDKENKKNKLANIDSVYSYYTDELNRLMTYAVENPNDLVKSEDTFEEEDAFESEEVEEKPIFDEIASIEEDAPAEEEEASAFANSLFSDEKDLTFVDPVSVSLDEEPAAPVVEDAPVEESVSAFDTTPVVETVEEPDLGDVLDPNHVHEEDLYKDETDISKLFAADSKDSFDSLDIQALSDNIDKEYANIFGNSADIALTDADDTFKVDNINQNVFDTRPRLDEEPLSDLNLHGDALSNTGEFNFFGDTEPVESVTAPVAEAPVVDENDAEIVNFFKNNNLDFYKFSKDEQDKLRSGFNVINYTKTLDILRQNNINLDYLYGAADIFKVIHNELESIINKLLVAGQTSANISCVLNALPYVNSFDLQDVIDSYGPQIKDANIADLIVKAKHLKELGGGAE